MANVLSVPGENLLARVGAGGPILLLCLCRLQRLSLLNER